MANEVTRAIRYAWWTVVVVVDGLGWAADRMSELRARALLRLYASEGGRHG